jgi:hypothetical protein
VGAPIVLLMWGYQRADEGGVALSDTAETFEENRELSEFQGYQVHEAAGAEARERPLWVEVPARRPRLADPVRTAAVRAGLTAAVTVLLAVIAFLLTMAKALLAFPAVIAAVAGIVAATWAVLDVWVTRQVWNQRYGVVSAPSSTARQLRRERRAARRQERAAEREFRRIRRRGGQPAGMA